MPLPSPVAEDALPSSDDGDPLPAPPRRAESAKRPRLAAGRQARAGATSSSNAEMVLLPMDVESECDLPSVCDDQLDDMFTEGLTLALSKKEKEFIKCQQRRGRRAWRRFPGKSIKQVLGSSYSKFPDYTAPVVPRGLDGTLPDDVCEIFSPPRILRHTARLGLRGDLSADLKTGWDFSIASVQAQLLGELRRRRPRVAFLEPPCTWFSIMLNMNWEKMPVDLREQGILKAVALFEFCLLVAIIQVTEGRAFVLEHPLGASSWGHPWVAIMKRMFPGIAEANFDFCMFGMVTKETRTPVKKATRLLGNCGPITRAFNNVRCDGSHHHTVCIGAEGGEKRSTYAQYYPDAFCKRVAECIQEYKLELEATG